LQREYIYDESCGLVTAEVDDTLVGHCFFSTFEVDGKKGVWISQQLW